MANAVGNFVLQCLHPPPESTSRRRLAGQHRKKYLQHVGADGHLADVHEEDK